MFTKAKQGKIESPPNDKGREWQSAKGQFLQVPGEVRKRVWRVQDLGRAWERDKKQVFDEIKRRKEDISDKEDEVYWSNFYEAFFEKDDKEALQTQRTRHQGYNKD